MLRLFRDLAFEKPARMHSFHVTELCAFVIDQFDRACIGLQCPNDPATGARMGAQHGKRVVVIAGDQCLVFVILVHWHNGL